VTFHDVFTRVFTVEGAIAGGVFVLVALALVVAVVRRRAGRGVEPSRTSERNRLEWVYVTLLAGAAAFLVWFTVSANAQDTASAHPAKVAGPAPARVSVTAFQWCWRFHYLDAPVTVTGACTTNDYPTIVVPTGRPVEIELTSQDVVHSFWIPALDVKVDAYPDHTNTFDLNFSKPGRWLGRCAEYCGTYHTTMDFWLDAVSPTQYQQWLAQHGGQA
jgi:cytochrome c oxidase subunit 2